MVIGPALAFTGSLSSCQSCQGLNVLNVELVSLPLPAKMTRVQDRFDYRSGRVGPGEHRPHRRRSIESSKAVIFVASVNPPGAGWQKGPAAIGFAVGTTWSR